MVRSLAPPMHSKPSGARGSLGTCGQTTALAPTSCHCECMIDDDSVGWTRNSISWDKSAQISDFSENDFPGSENEKDTGFELMPVALGQRKFHIRFPKSRSNFRILISLKRLESNQKSVHIQLESAYFIKLKIFILRTINVQTALQTIF